MSERPAYYGGEDDPFETIKVMKARLSLQEFAGALKFNAYKYMDRHDGKDGLRDLKKGAWYYQRLVEFVEEMGHDDIWPKRVYWTADDPLYHVEYVNDLDIPTLKLTWVFSNEEPRARVYVRHPIDNDDATDLESFDGEYRAKEFIRSLTKETDDAQASRDQGIPDRQDEG